MVAIVYKTGSLGYLDWPITKTICSRTGRSVLKWEKSLRNRATRTTEVFMIVSADVWSDQYVSTNWVALKDRPNPTSQMSCNSRFRPSSRPRYGWRTATAMQTARC